MGGRDEGTKGTDIYVAGDGGHRHICRWGRRGDARATLARRGGNWVPWVVIFAAAVALRVGYLFSIEDLVYFRHLVGDARGYDGWARRLVDGGWHWAEAYYQAPLYPYFLAGVYQLLGRDPWTVRVVQCVLGSAGCVAVGLGAARLVNRRAGIVAAAMLAAYPPAIFFDGIVQKASLAFALTGFLLCVLALVAAKPTWRRWSLCGVVLGLLALTRENALALTPVLIAWVFIAGDRARPHAWTSAGAFIAGLCVTLSPAAYHNYRVCGEFALTTFQTGPNFYMGNHAGADGRYSPIVPGRESPEFERTDATAAAEHALGRTLSPGEVSHYWLGRAWSFMRSEPGAWLRLMWTKWWLTWNRYEIPDTESHYVYAEHSRLLGGPGRVFHFGVLCPLAVLGAMLLGVSRREYVLLYVLALTMAMSVAFFYVFGRYRFPLVPILAVMAAGGLVDGVAHVRAGRWKRLAVALPIAAVSAVWVNWPVNPERELNAAQLGNLGVALAGRGDMAGALPLLERAVSMYPPAPRLRQSLADALSMVGRYAESIPHYRAALAVEPGRANADYNLAVALERVGRKADALSHYRRALEVNPDDEEARQAVRRLTGE